MTAPQLELCKSCLHYVRREEPVCPFCRRDPKVPGPEYQVRNYDGQLAFRQLGDILAARLRR